MATIIDRKASAARAWDTIRARKAGILPPAAKTGTEKKDEQLARLRNLMRHWMGAPDALEAPELEVVPEVPAVEATAVDVIVVDEQPVTIAPRRAARKTATGAKQKRASRQKAA